MKILEARKLIKDTFENTFVKERFTLFINNLLKDKYESKPFIQAGAQLPAAYAEHFRKLERIGKYQDTEGNIVDLLIVELKRQHSIEWARTAQRNFIRRYLNGSRGGELKDAAIVAFFTEGSDEWRFSLIKMQYSLEKKKDDLTPAKRFSFLVGKDEKSHTAQRQLAALLTKDEPPTLGDLEASFNIETVTKEFFEKYKALYIDLSEHLEKQLGKNRSLEKELSEKQIDHISFTKKLLGQIVFLYFIQKKGWLGVPKDGKWGDGDKKYLRTLLEKAIAGKQSFHTEFLQFLFYEALAEQRKAGDPSYYKRLDCRIPFLNGGLFEADYDWKTITIKIPNELFTNEESTKEGDTGTGILDVFDRYNFTVKEDEPLDKEVAVDPEMLGKVFENLLEVKDRKSKGAYYTPREIVHYMCQESLINYLDTTLNGNPAAYEKLGAGQTDLFGNKSRKGQLAVEIEHGQVIKVAKEDIEKFIREGTSAIDHDARVEKQGRETEAYSYQLPESVRKYASDLDQALADIRVCDPAIGSGAFPVGIMNEIVKAREILTTYLPQAKEDDRTLYELKRHCIQECIYGVDIDHSAIDVAKLRLWLSLVVDEEDFFKIKPLPNLDYKIVQGNSLVGYPYEPRGLDEIEKLKSTFFEITDIEKKLQYRKKINKTIETLLKNTERTLGYKVDFDFRIHFSEVFHENGGFDIVIGNPPYKEISDKHEKHFFQINYREVLTGHYDLYIFFFKRGIDLLSLNGTLAYITPHTFIVYSQFENLRKWLYSKTQIIEITDRIASIFESAVVDNSITILTKSTSVAHTKFSKFTYDAAELRNTSNVLLAKSEYNWESFDLKTIQNKKVLNKYQLGSKPLGDVYESSQGITVYAKVQGAKRDYFRDKKETKHSKPVTRGREISKYSLQWSKTYIEYGNWLWCPRDVKYFESPKLFLRQTAADIVATFVNEPFYCIDSVHSVIQKHDSPGLKYLLGILNSKLGNYFYHLLIVEQGKVFAQVKLTFLRKIPIRIVSNVQQNKVEALVDKILTDKKVDPTANTSRLEKQIDIMIYHLYNLKHEEAKIIDPELKEEEFEKYKF